MEPLTKERIVNAIGKVIQIDKPLIRELRSEGLGLSLVEYADDWDGILENEGIKRTRSLPLLEDMTPWFFGMEIRGAADGAEHEGKLCGVLTIYVAFSSWNGRILYLDRLRCSKMNGNIEKLFLRILAEIACDLQFARLTWRVRTWHAVIPCSGK